MIDLRKKGLPNAITVNGNSFLINTDFREWIKFGELLNNKDLKYKELEYLFICDSPKYPYMPQLLDFYSNKNVTPKDTGEIGEKIIDYVLDGEYIVASFFQAYNIDLTNIEYLHWHLFKALINGLPSNTYMKEIMSMRSYKKNNKSYEQQQRELKEIWKLPTNKSIQDIELIEEINKQFYNC